MKKGGNILDWSTAQWKAVGLAEVLEDKEELCWQRRESLLIVSVTKRNLDDTVTLCRKTGGEMPQTMSQPRR